MKCSKVSVCRMNDEVAEAAQSATDNLCEALEFLINAQRAKDQHEFIDGDDDDLGDSFDIKRKDVYATHEAARANAIAALKKARGEA